MQLSRWPRPFPKPNVKEQEQRQRQSDGQMNPASPLTQAFAAGVVKSVSSDRQNTERAKEQRAVATVPARAPSEAHVTGKKHSYKHQNRHRGGAVDFHRPRLCTDLEIAR